jgi:bacillithiol biosynthesis cysteine-adding enzyme BshC
MAPEELLARVPARAPASGETVAAIVASLQAQSAPAASLDAARALGQPDRLAVIAGQQPGLLGGPLYTFFKAAGALRLAAELNEAEEEHGSPRRWVPVFWNASEDHDFDEANRVFLEDPEGAPPRRFAAKVDGGGRALRDMPASDPAFGVLLDEVEAALPASEFRDGTMALLRETRNSAASVSEWTSRILLRWFGSRGLVIVEPDHVRAAAVPLLRAELERPGRLSAAVREGIARARAEGRTPVLAGDRDVNLFVTHEGRRTALERAEGGYRRTGSDDVASAGAWIRRLEEDPRSFSTNVHLRPIVQDATLPVGIQLGGPSEVAYLRELRPAFAAMGVPPAVVLPRPSATVVERRVERWLASFGVTAEAYLADPSALDAAGDAEDPGAEALARFARLRETIEPQLVDLIESATRLDPGLAKKLGRTVGQTREGIDRSERAFVDAVRQKAGVGRRQRARITHALRPFGGPQERVYGLAPFLARYGPGVVDALIDGLDGEIVRLPPEERRER